MNDRSAVILKRDRLQSAAPYTLVAVLTIICLAYQASFLNIPPKRSVCKLQAFFGCYLK